ncbi:hypothetical protein A2U01_0012863, partial [Trifolium medium]|nr:hypothetical protein [Trifolium medium]
VRRVCKEPDIIEAFILDGVDYTPTKSVVHEASLSDDCIDKTSNISKLPPEFPIGFVGLNSIKWDVTAIKSSLNDDGKSGQIVLLKLIQKMILR